jgi:hypothetical protein
LKAAKKQTVEGCDATEVEERTEAGNKKEKIGINDIWQ